MPICCGTHPRVRGRWRTHPGTAIASRTDRGSAPALRRRSGGRRGDTRDERTRAPDSG